MHARTHPPTHAPTHAPTNTYRYVEQPEEAAKLVELFLPYLRLKSTPRTERVKEDVLSLLAGLIRVAAQPQQHLRTISQLFGTVRARGSRAALAQLFLTLTKLPSLEADAEIGPEIGTLREMAATLVDLSAYSEVDLMLGLGLALALG